MADIEDSPSRGAGAVNPDYAYASFQEKEDDYIAVFERFLARCYAPQLERLFASLHGRDARAPHSGAAALASAESGTDASQSCFAFSVRVCAQRLLDHAPAQAALLFRFPDLVLPLFHRALAKQLVQRSAALTGIATLPVRTRQKLKVRVEFLPPVAQLRKPTISAIRSSDTKKLIQVAGTVVRTGMIKMQETQRQVECAKCHERFFVKADLEQGNILELPRVCPSDHGGAKKPCKSTQFETIESTRIVSDHQVIKIQEQVSKLGVGSIPRSILVVLEEDLVDAVKAGDHVVVVGVLMRMWRPCIQGVRCDLETLVRANSIRVQNATAANVLVTEELKKEFGVFWNDTYRHEPMRGRDVILASVCPKVYGLFVVKLALALTIIGGCSHVDATGMRTRGESHMLLIGDPGTGKSQFLRFAAELSPRSVLTTGIGTTSAGLTCTAVKDGTEWMLEAGALVLADRGVCCIDEFSSIRAHDRASIHEAMEQQTLSVAKAGLVCKLNARTTIFAVTNPKGRYDPNADVSVNTSIASPLLSRFDLILVLLDTRNAHWDEVVSSFILQQSTDETTKPLTFSSEPKKEESSSTSWSVGKLQAYICHVKDKLQPQLTREAMTILQRYYQLQRASEGRSAARTTIRLLESLTRLSQAHARLLYHEHVETVDAVVAVFLMEVSKASDSSSSMLGGGLDSVLHSDFPDDPTAEYALQEKLVLEYLGLGELATVSRAPSPPGTPPPQVDDDGKPPGTLWVSPRGRGSPTRCDDRDEDHEETKGDADREVPRQKRSLPAGVPTVGFQWRPPGGTASSAGTRWRRTRPEEFALQTTQSAHDSDMHNVEGPDEYDHHGRKRPCRAMGTHAGNESGLGFPVGQEKEATNETSARDSESQSTFSGWRAWTQGAQSRVARWSQSDPGGPGRPRHASQGGGGEPRGGGGGHATATASRGGEKSTKPAVTSKWWRRDAAGGDAHH